MSSVLHHEKVEHYLLTKLSSRFQKPNITRRLARRSPASFAVDGPVTSHESQTSRYGHMLMDQVHLSVNQREADQDHYCDGLRRDRDCHRLRQGSRSRAGNPSDLAGFAFGSYREGRDITGNRTRLRHRAFFRADGDAFRGGDQSV